VIDLRQSKPYATHMRNLGWQVEKNDGACCYLRKFPLLGYFCKIQRPPKLTQNLIDTIERKYHPFHFIIEPDINTDYSFLITRYGFRQSKSTYLPSCTLIQDLTQSEYALYKSFTKDTRRLLRITQNQEISETNDISLFHHTFKNAVNRSRYVPSIKNLMSLQNTFGKKSLFLLTRNHTAGAVFLRTMSTGYYWLAFTNQEGRRNKSQYQVLWQGLEWAKKEGCQNFDFEGIYDERFPVKSWLGFTHFKKSFGGKEVKYPGTFSRIYWKNLLKLK